MEASPFVTFVERSGVDAEAQLTGLARRLRAAATPVRLLRSRDEAELYLLVIEGAPDLAPDDAAGARVWRFEEASP